jgi:hypothetical protein
MHINLWLSCLCCAFCIKSRFYMPCKGAKLIFLYKKESRSLCFMPVISGLSSYKERQIEGP